MITQKISSFITSVRQNPPLLWRGRSIVVIASLAILYFIFKRIIHYNPNARESQNTILNLKARMSTLSSENKKLENLSRTQNKTIAELRLELQLNKMPTHSDTPEQDLLPIDSPTIFAPSFLQQELNTNQEQILNLQNELTQLLLQKKSSLNATKMMLEEFTFEMAKKFENLDPLVEKASRPLMKRLDLVTEKMNSFTSKVKTLFTESKQTQIYLKKTKQENQNLASALEDLTSEQESQKREFETTIKRLKAELEAQRNENTTLAEELRNAQDDLKNHLQSHEEYSFNSQNGSFIEESEYDQLGRSKAFSQKLCADFVIQCREAVTTLSSLLPADLKEESDQLAKLEELLINISQHLPSSSQEELPGEIDSTSLTLFKESQPQ